MPKILRPIPPFPLTRGRWSYSTVPFNNRRVWLPLQFVQTVPRVRGTHFLSLPLSPPSLPGQRTQYLQPRCRAGSGRQARSTRSALITQPEPPLALPSDKKTRPASIISHQCTVVHYLTKATAHKTVITEHMLHPSSC